MKHEWKTFGAYRETDTEPTEEQIVKMKREVALELTERIVEGHFIIHSPLSEGRYTVGAVIQVRA